MTTEQRIENIEAFLYTQRYLHGLKYQIKETPKGFLVEFLEATTRQMSELHRQLQNNQLTHIEIKARQIKQFDKPKFKYPNHGSNNKKH